MCIKAGLVQECAHFVKQQQRHGLQGKGSEHETRVLNPGTLGDAVFSVLLYSIVLLLVFSCTGATGTSVEMLR